MWTIYLKEMLELARDRKMLLFTVLIPMLVMPLFMGGFAYASYILSKNALQEELAYAIFGTENGPELSQRFASTKGFKRVKLINPDAIKSAIDNQTIAFALVIPPGFETDLAHNVQATLALHYNSAVTVNVVDKRVQEVVAAHKSYLRERALTSLGLSKAQLGFTLNPIKLESHSTADKREQLGVVIGEILPYILLMICMMATQYPAIDLGAGEKERGTLETLLLAPVPRSSLVLAKFGVLFTAGMTAALLMVANIGLLLAVFGERIDPNLMQVVHSIGTLDLFMLALMLVPTAAIFASLLLSISIYAKNFKEAQGFNAPLIFMTMLCILLADLPGMKLNWLWAMMPVTNVSLAMRELIKGTMDYRMFLVIFLSTSIIAGALLNLCRWWFTREEVLFRD
jgi:sodium transport system permease protein